MITVELDVPNPPLTWDPHLIPPHQALHTAWSKGHGFEVVDGANKELSIASAEISGNTVVLTLSDTPLADANSP